MMIYKCNLCGDTFPLDKQDKWSAYCFHCGIGLLQLIKSED
jgi:DNA-directed RNA polymerase subunit RPC12/RpoP